MSHAPAASPPRSRQALPPGLEIRLMREADLAAYKTLRDAMLARHEEAFTSDATAERGRDAESYRSRLGGSGHCLFTLLAWDGRQLLGALSAERDGRAKIRHIAHIVGMMVDETAQGRGLGRALMQAALALLSQDETLQLVTLSVTRSNAPARRLYERCGFARYGRLEGAIVLPDGRVLDKDLMVHRLHPPGPVA
ncbi:MAG TPA: GNAT family N-acetyltransferase [Burkholderiaceae bacterium]|nr:GNAT family N-acetyltransferase [Burkholderiaceae bacterium]